MLPSILFLAFSYFAPFGDHQASAVFSWAISAALLSAVYAFTDEFHQSFVPTRTASFLDVGIDTAGGIDGANCYRLPAVGGS